MLAAKKKNPKKQKNKKSLAVNSVILCQNLLGAGNKHVEKEIYADIANLL